MEDDGISDILLNTVPNDYTEPKGTQYVYVRVYEGHSLSHACKTCSEAREAHNPRFNNIYLGVVKLPLEYVYVR